MVSFKPISISLSPNTEKDDVFLALKLLFQPWHWKKELPEVGPLAKFPEVGPLANLPETRPLANLEEEFKKYLGVKYAISFNSGRSALMGILEALNIKEGDEILLQAFTCNSAVIPILKQKARPIYVDIDQTLNLDPGDLKRKITPQSKAVIIQHTFGWPAQIEEISKIAKEKKLYLIEDCAHSLGAKYKGKFCGTFGDAAFFSFGRDKVISSVFGGMAVTNNEEIGKRIKDFQEKLSFPSHFWILQQLLHPLLVNFLILPAYGLSANLGRMLLLFFQHLFVLSKAVSKKEKKGKIPKDFPKRLPAALAILALNQFRKLERFNEHRRKIAKVYEENLKNKKFILPLFQPQKEILPVFMRYPIIIDSDPEWVLNEARKRKIYLDDGWRLSPIVPPDTRLDKMTYNFGSCPRAEKMAKKIINLPTHININSKETQKILNLLMTHF